MVGEYQYEFCIHLSALLLAQAVVQIDQVLIKIIAG
jgi:hypothetical protein